MRSFNCASALVIASLWSTTANAQAASPTGFYVGANVGTGKLHNPTVTYYDAGGTFGGTGVEDTIQTRFHFKNALTYAGTVGYDFGMLRGDVEVSYARFKVRSFTVQNVNGTAIDLTADDRAELCDYIEATCGGSGNTFEISGSRARQLSGFGNLWLDIPVGPVTPYVGGGLGVSGFEVDGDGKAKFAWQLGAGAALNLSRTIALTVDYRHRQLGRTNIAWDDASGMRVGKLKTDSLSAGVRIYFGGGRAEPAPAYAPPPPPPPPPAPVMEEPSPPPPPPPPPAEAPSGERG